MNIIEKFKYNQRMKKDDRIFDELLIETLKRDLHDENLECFRFMNTDQIKEVIQRNYKNVNEITLSFAVCKIANQHFLDEFSHYKEFSDRIDFEQIVREMQEKEGC